MWNFGFNCLCLFVVYMCSTLLWKGIQVYNYNPQNIICNVVHISIYYILFFFFLKRSRSRTTIFVEEKNGNRQNGSWIKLHWWASSRQMRISLKIIKKRQMRISDQYSSFFFLFLFLNVMWYFIYVLSHQIDKITLIWLYPVLYNLKW